MHIKSLTTTERLTLVISALALVVSLASVYFQFFYISESVTAAKVNFDASMAQAKGTFQLDIALINNGNRDVLVLEHTPSVSNLKLTVGGESRPPHVLKPQEIKLVPLRGEFEVDITEPNAEVPLYLKYRLVGARGFDVSGKKQIGKVIVGGGTLVGIEILKRPINLD